MDALRTVGVAGAAQLGVGLAAGKTSGNERRLDLDDIDDAVQKEWRSVVRRHGDIVDSEYAAIGRTDTTYSSERLASEAETKRNDRQVTTVQRIEFEDGYTAEVLTAMDRNVQRNGGTFRKQIDDKRFKTDLSPDDVRTLQRAQREERVGVHSTTDLDFAASADPDARQVASLSDKTDFGGGSPRYDYTATDANRSESGHDCPGPCWIQGINWATDTDEADNRCGVSMVDAVVSIEADAYAEVYTTALNNVKTADFDITFDGYTKGTVSSPGMAAGTDFLGFVKNLDTGDSEAIHLGTLSSKWYDFVDIIDEQGGRATARAPVATRRTPITSSPRT